MEILLDDLSQRLTADFGKGFTAGWLLRCPYDHARGKPTGWSVYKRTPVGWMPAERL